MPSEPLPHRAGSTRCARHAIGVAVLGAVLGGCATRVDVQPMATGRADVAAFELKGADVQTLRHQAQRLCPLGGEILREAGHSLPPEADTGRWRSTLHTLAAWAEPPRRPAQLVVACRKAGDHDKLQVVAAPQPMAPRAATPTAEVTAALPVGPVNPEW